MTAQQQPFWSSSSLQDDQERNAVSQIVFDVGGLQSSLILTKCNRLLLIYQTCKLYAEVDCWQDWPKGKRFESVAVKAYSRTIKQQLLTVLERLI